MTGRLLETSLALLGIVLLGDGIYLLGSGRWHWPYRLPPRRAAPPEHVAAWVRSRLPRLVGLGLTGYGLAQLLLALVLEPQLAAVRVQIQLVATVVTLAVVLLQLVVVLRRLQLGLRR